MECVNPYSEKKEKEISPRDMPPQQKEVGGANLTLLTNSVSAIEMAYGERI